MSLGTVYQCYFYTKTGKLEEKQHNIDNEDDLKCWQINLADPYEFTEDEKEIRDFEIESAWDYDGGPLSDDPHFGAESMESADDARRLLFAKVLDTKDKYDRLVRILQDIL